MTDHIIEVSEVFGPTFQGEGPSVGQQAVFLRLRRCNLQCSWCDTKYTWSKEDPGYQDYTQWKVPALADHLNRQKRDANLLVITGGEPLIWQHQLSALLLQLAYSRIEVETNGTIMPSLQGVHYNVSPKLESSGNTGLVCIRESPLGRFSQLTHEGLAAFKFVVTVASWEQDRNEILRLQQQFGFSPPYIMAEGTTDTTQISGMRLLAQDILTQGWSLTPRLHTLIWKNERGR